MRLKMKLYIKMLLLILTTSFVIFGTSILVISLKIKEKAFESSTQYADLTAEVNARKVKGKMGKFMSTAQSLNSLLLSFESLDQSARRNNFMFILNNILEENEDILALFTIWEPNAIDNQDSLYINKPGNTYIGNFAPTYYRTNDSIKLEGLSTGPLYQGAYYTEPKESHNQTLLEPYYYSYAKGEEKEILQTSMISPLLHHGQFLGVVGADASLTTLQKFAEQIKPFDNSYAFLVANEGTIVAHKTIEFVGKKIDTLQFSVPIQEIINKVKWNHKHNFTDIDPVTGEKTYFTMNSLRIGEANERWVFGIAVPISELNSVANKSFLLSIVTGLIALAVFSIFIYIIAKSISRPLTDITKVLKEIAIGNINKNLKTHSRYNDEINDMAESVNKLIDGLNATAEFAKQIGEGNLDKEHKLLSKEDYLGQALVDMRESLKEAKKLGEEKRENDRKQAWVTQGLAKFGEILREDNDNMHKFAVNIARNLTEYMEIPQCAIFIIEEDEEEKTFFDLKAAYALGSEKLIEKKIHDGEELVGRALSEKSTIHLTNVPEEFVNIRTGKSEDDVPNNLLIVPMMMNQETFGVMELLAMKPFEPYQIEFAERVAESIAATISSVKTNIRTAHLLKQSEELKDELSQQEEEMRQNLEEMQATQEEAQTREAELTTIRDTLEKTVMMAEYDLEGRIIKINDLMAKTYGHSPEHMLGKFQDAFVTQDDASRRSFLKFWQEVISGVTKKRLHEIVKRDKTVYLNETYIPIMEDDEIDRVLNIAVETTHKVELDKKITQLMNKIGELKNE